MTPNDDVSLRRASISTHRPPPVRDKRDFLPNGRWYHPVVRVSGPRRRHGRVPVLPKLAAQSFSGAGLGADAPVRSDSRQASRAVGRTAEDLPGLLLEKALAPTALSREVDLAEALGLAPHLPKPLLEQALSTATTSRARSTASDRR